MPDGFRIPPQAVEVEKHVIGGLLLGSVEAYGALDTLSKEDFYDDRHGILFAALKSLHAADSSLDLLTLSEALKRDAIYDRSGGEQYLLEISAEVVSAAGMDDHCAIVKERSTRRKLIRDASAVLEAAWTEGIPCEEVRGIAEARLLDGSHAEDKGLVTAKDALISTLSLIERAHKGELQGLQTQFPLFNEMTGGICAPDWIVLAGRPAVGKTALALDIADYLATDEQKQVLFFSLEMSKEQLMQRLICRRQGIDFQALRTGRLPRSEFTKVAAAVRELRDSKLRIDDCPDANPSKILSLARRHKAKHGLDLVVVDNLSIMEADRHTENRLQEVSSITRALKKNAKRLEAPIMTLVHFSRALEARGEDAIPRMADLRECGTIEQDADVVFGMHKPDRMGTRVDIYGLKQRNGPSDCIIPLTSQFQYQRFAPYKPVDGFMGTATR